MPRSIQNVVKQGHWYDLLLFQTETPTQDGYYCHAKPSFLTSNWFVVGSGVSFGLLFAIPFTLILHNYAIIGRTLFKSLQDNPPLKEGIE